MLQERELLVSAGKMGRDMEHCQALLEKLDGTQADASVDQTSVESANCLGQKLIAQGRSSKDEVQQQLNELNEALVLFSSFKKLNRHFVQNISGVS